MKRVVVVGVGGCGFSILELFRSKKISIPERLIDVISLDLRPRIRSALDFNELLLSRDESVNKPFNKKQLDDFLLGADFMVVVGGMGGWAGSMLTPFLLQMAKNHNLHTSAMLVFPFAFEGKTRNQMARDVVQCARSDYDYIFVVNNNDNHAAPNPEMPLDAYLQWINEKIVNEFIRTHGSVSDS
jgi:cell division GTPase FtsZ